MSESCGNGAGPGTNVTWNVESDGIPMTSAGLPPFGERYGTGTAGCGGSARRPAAGIDQETGWTSASAPST